MKRFIRFFGDSGQVTKKDLKDFYRDRARIISFIIMPLFMMIMVGYVFPSQSSLKDVPIGILNLDKPAAGQVSLSDQVISTLGSIPVANSTKKVMIVKPVQNEATIKELIQKQELSGAIVIPENFSNGLLKDHKQQKITIITDQSNPQISSILTTMLGQVFNTMGKQMSTVAIRSTIGTQLSSNTVTALVTPMAVETKGLVAGKPNYFQFVAPGVIAMVTMMAVMMGLAGSIAREKEQGTMDGILVAPVSRLSIIMGKTGAQTVRGLLQGTIVLLLAMTLFHVKIYGNFLIMLVVVILGIFSFVGLGILVSAAVEEQETAMTIMMTVTFPMLFLSGAFFPVQQMPGFMQAISKCIPLTYEVQALRQVVVLGAGLSEVLRPILILLAFGVVTLAISVPAFKRVITT
ncbi:MAG TPA: ABC transporter permease [Candidatus Anoxymicrobiaceae bacterium]